MINYIFFLVHPSIESKPRLIVNESEDVTFIREISSNPLSNAYWYIGTLLLKTEIAVKTATFKKENVTCTDTKNFTLVASNGIGNNSTAWLELIVNCKYKKCYTDFLGRDIMFAYFDDTYKRFTKIKLRNLNHSL